jgi:SAM-dependent methyltransferase
MKTIASIALIAVAVALVAFCCPQLADAADTPGFAPVYAVQVPAPTTAAVYQYSPPAQAPTPIAEVRRVLALLNPQSHETFVDYGCGDGRWLIEAARTYGCRAVGIEIDPQQADRARRAVDAAGLLGRVQIIEGDVLMANVEAQVGVAYLYPDLLAKLRPKLLKLNRFATPFHPVDGVQMSQSGDAWIWQKPQAVQQQAYAVYEGQYYSSRVCNSPGCSMCNSIQRQLSRGRWSN